MLSFSKMRKERDIKWGKLYELLSPYLYRKLDNVTLEQERQICDLYKQGMSSTRIGYKFRLYHKVVNAILENNEISRKGNGLRKYSLDEHYFDNIDTPNKAYILGFLYADGYNNEATGVIGISVQEQDKDILQKILLDSNALFKITYTRKGKNKTNNARIQLKDGVIQFISETGKTTFDNVFKIDEIQYNSEEIDMALCFVLEALKKTGTYDRTNLSGNVLDDDQI